MSTARKISVIIPVLNEEELLPATLAALREEEELEVIVVDGGSRDNSVAVARKAGARVLQTPPGRARQMNAGAEAARTERLLFLHADTRLPRKFTAAVCRCLARPQVAAGAFRLAIAGEGLGLRLTEKMINWRSTALGLPYGDQALFLPAARFRRVGGFPELPLMEDFELVRQLHRLGRIAILPLTATTSARRWRERGVLGNTMRNQLIIIAHLLGISPDRLARWYRGEQ